MFSISISISIDWSVDRLINRSPVDRSRSRSPSLDWSVLTDQSCSRLFHSFDLDLDRQISISTDRSRSRRIDFDSIDRLIDQSINPLCFCVYVRQASRTDSDSAVAPPMPTPPYPPTRRQIRTDKKLKNKTKQVSAAKTKLGATKRRAQEAEGASTYSEKHIEEGGTTPEQKYFERTCL